jgi:bacillithiol biosynthesis cysteine-adding enzyme BshC
MPALKSHCFPFRQVPHTTRLFLDFIERTPSTHPFYRRSPMFLEWAEDEAANVQYPADRRAHVAEILDRQNKSFGSSEKTLENIAAFRSGALALVTGQQVGLFGGPVFSLYKALSAVKTAAEARKLGIECVPVFWLATEDHDLEEVNQVKLPGVEGNLEMLSCAAHDGQDAPVASFHFGGEIDGLTERAKQLLGDSEISTWISDCYRPEESFGTAFAKLFARIFADFGVILLDASDPELDAIAAPIYKEVLGRATEFNRALLERDQELQAADYHRQVRITNTTTPLFLIRQGSRIPLHLKSEDEFVVGEERVPKAELLQLAVSTPSSFSPNVLLRPVLQDYLLPTLAYVGGAAEVAYFAQLGVLYDKLLGRVTPILPRFSATLIESKPRTLLERYELGFHDLFQGDEFLRQKLGARLLDPKLQSSFEQAQTAVECSMVAVREALEQLDKTLTDSAKNAEAKMLHQLSTLRSRAARAELRQSEVAERHSRLLSNALYPDKTLQERELAGAYFLGRHGTGLLHSVLDVINPACLDHQLVTL